MLGTWPTHQPPWTHPMLHLWVSSNKACQPSHEGRTWGYHEADYALNSGKCPQTAYHRENQVPEHHQCLYFHVLVLRSRNAKEMIEQRNNWLLFHLAPCDSHVPLTTLLSAQKLFPPFLLQRWLVNNISTRLWSLVDGNSTHNQLGPRDVQPCPVFLSFFSKEIHKAKSWKNISVNASSQGLWISKVYFEHQSGNISVSSRLVSDTSII